jgi:hypothetical protein
MRRTAAVIQWIVRLAGITQIITGILFWTGRSLTLVPMHMALGLAIAIALFILAILAWRGGVAPAAAVAGLVLAVAVPALGMTQTRLLVGPWHWAIRVVHLLIGLAALGTAENFANHIRGRTK